MKKVLFTFTIILTFAILGLSHKNSTRKPLDDVGFCWEPYQIEGIIKKSIEFENFKLDAKKVKKTVGALSPHDDYLYAGRVYIHSIPYLKNAKIVVIIGVTHSRARKVINDRKGIIIFDEFSFWKAPYGNIKVSPLREYVENYFNKKGLSELYLASSTAHQMEHSIEAMLPWLQYFNRNFEIFPIMITGMSTSQMKEISKILSDGIKEYAKEKNLEVGKDIKVLISADNTHYGRDFEYAPYGEDKNAHKIATSFDKMLGKKYLSGKISDEKIIALYNQLNKKNVTWCGRFSVPFGLFLMKNLFGNIKGIPQKYGDSYTLGTLPFYGNGLGTTAPFSLKHWVGYWAITFEKGIK